MATGLRMTLEEFLAWELRQEGKHEWVDGEVIAFAGATNRHGSIAMRLGSRILQAAGRCQTLGSDALIQMATSARYADLVVTCDERDRPADRTVRYPKLIVEVLSESTAAVDRSQKFDEYTAIETLEEYVLLDSRKRWSQVWRRTTAGWSATPVPSSGPLHLASIDLTVDLDEIYRDLDID